MTQSAKQYCCSTTDNASAGLACHLSGYFGQGVKCQHCVGQSRFVTFSFPFERVRLDFLQ